MQTSIVAGKAGLIVQIKNKISEICDGEAGGAVNLENFFFRESDASGYISRMSISCIFIDDDGRVCADMYRFGSTGSFDFICGLVIDFINEKTLKKIISALEDKRWSVAVNPVSCKKKKNKFVSVLKLPFIQKGA